MKTNPLVLLIAALVAAFAGTLAAAPAPRPNIVFLLADDLGYGDLGCYGAPDIRTPNIDALAQRGVRLTDFYANACVCTPTRTALMTGRYQQRIGGLEWAIYAGRKNLGLPAQEKTVATLLRDAGYATAMSGKWHLGYDPPRAPNAHGFQRFFGLLSGNHNYFTHAEGNGEPDLSLDGNPIALEGYSTHLLTRYALEFLDAMPADRPFFLYVPFNAPHFPFQGPDDRDKVLPKHNGGGDRATYVKMVESLDEAVGQIVRQLAARGLTDRTLLVFASDNGGETHARNLPLSGKKGAHHEGGIRVPCIAVWPGQLPAGAVSAQVGITMDWTATMLALAGAAPPANRPLDGIDLLPVLAGREPLFDRALFWRQSGPDGKLRERAMRAGHWKYLWSPDGREELYDLAADLAEQHNLAAARPSLARELRLRLDAWERDISPPLYDQNPDQLTGYK